eukprot:TRINITY_DN13184_c0_g1_i1.p1 TRINITY_DN13184_c0_g1~~TRINITY_DN13184_c0_g1_i1.p1  ORF type:complete len:348 (+),score=60.63 TRINITY_DN13184_c0_g1_i1:95-1138(+)
MSNNSVPRQLVQPNLSTYAQSDEYKRFRKWVALQRVNVDSFTDKTWKYYDSGPKNTLPLVMLPGTTGTAEIYYPQFLSLCPRGLRIISVQWPVYDTHERWVKGFDRFLDSLKLDKIHLFGTSLGGYLAQCFVHYKPNRVLSLILCNSFCDLQYFANNAPCAGMFNWMPEFVLKRILLSNFPNGTMEKEIANSIDFMVEQLETLGQKDLASRLTLNCTRGPLKTDSLGLSNDKLTILDTLDEIATPDQLREGVYKAYPNARRALMKTGGNFPYLSRSEEVNMHLTVHLRRYGFVLEDDKNNIKALGEDEEESENDQYENSEDEDSFFESISKRDTSNKEKEKLLQERR